MLIWRCWRSRVGFMARIPPSCVWFDRDVVQTTSFSPQRHGDCGVLLATKPTISRVKWARASGLKTARCSGETSNLKKRFEEALDSAQLVQVSKALEQERELPAFSEAAMQVLIEQEITGRSLLLMTTQELMEDDMKRGPAKVIMNLVAEANESDLRRLVCLESLCWRCFGIASAFISSGELRGCPRDAALARLCSLAAPCVSCPARSVFPLVSAVLCSPFFGTPLPSLSGSGGRACAVLVMMRAAKRLAHCGAVRWCAPGFSDTWRVYCLHFFAQRQRLCHPLAVR
eukprot:2234147-Rhodomonas_salina.1